MHAAGSAAEAMNSLGKIPGGVDGIIVDLGLPDRRGDALIREVRRFTRLCQSYCHRRRFEGASLAVQRGRENSLL